jgi:ABC-type dipeptide/oligopeptide/nickel transport system permease component
VAQYVAQRFLYLVPTLLGMTVVIFLILNVSGADPAVVIVGEFATEEVLDAVREQLRLDQPLPVRYLVWLANIVRGDFGTSLIDHRAVLPTILHHLPATVFLMLGSMVVAILIGIPTGALAAANRNTWIDHVSRVIALAGVSLPSFWVGLILIILFSVTWRILPIAGYGGLRHLVLPSLALGTALSALIMRLTRAGLLEVMQEDYMRTAQAKGVRRSVAVLKHAMRNAMLPLVTVLGLQVGLLLGGTVAVETVFSWPGIGRLAYTRMLQRDIPMVMGILLAYGVVLAIVNLLTDLTYALFDPRVRYD